MTRLAVLIATAGGVGFVPVAPGTFGSAVGLLIYLALRPWDSAVVELAVIAVTLALGVWSADVVEKQLGKDPHPVIIDEVVGMLITIALLDVTFAGAVAGFAIFRLLDVLKPWPAGRLEHLHGGPGVMLDDVVAGIYSHLVLRGLIMLFPGTLA